MKRRSIYIAWVASVLVVVATVALLISESRDAKKPEPNDQGSRSEQTQTDVVLSQAQLDAIKIEPVRASSFSLDKETVGSISFAEDRAVQVFPHVQGKLIQALHTLGDNVRQGEALYTIDSPDLLQAESNLISAAGVFEATSKELSRVQGLVKDNGVSERELEQAAADEQTAEGNLRAARNAVRVFGKSEAEIDQIIASRRVDPVLIVRSPISGQVTAFNAPPGLFVQPGNGTAPFTVANTSVKWMLASINESDIALFHIGQPVAVRVTAYPDRAFQGRISKTYASVDPATHRTILRSEISDSRNELRAGMLANFTIRVNSFEAVAVPTTAVVREGDGSMTVWVTTDRHHFSQRVVQVGVRNGDRVQILSGLQPGELVIADGGVFLSNMVQAAD